jgi:hypothetical protein
VEPVLFRFDARDCIDDAGIFARSYGRIIPGTFTRTGSRWADDGRGRPYALPTQVPGSEILHGQRALLVEPTRTSVSYTTDVRNAAWSAVRGAKDGALVGGPDERVTASSFIPTTENNQHHISRTIEVTASTWQSFVVELKYKGHHACVAIDSDGGANRIWVAVNLLTGAIGGSGEVGTGVLGTSEAQLLANGYVRVRVAGFISSSTSLAWRVFAGLTGTSAPEAFAGNDVDGFTVALLQPEVDAPNASSRMVSESATAATRSGETLYFDLAGLNPPRPLTIYQRSVHRGAYDRAPYSKWMMRIGAPSTGSDPRFALYVATGAAGAQYDDGLNVRSSAVASISYERSLGDVIEHRGVLTGNWTVVAGIAVNGGQETLGGETPAAAPSAAWNTARVYFSAAGAGMDPMAYLECVIADGGRSMDEMRELAGV